jgi:succinoglycan biosynthesis protein ExoO
MSGVSVVIPAYNAASFIGRAIDSVLAQTVPPLEILVVDDCSTDDTRAVLQARAHGLIRILETPRNGGPSVARNLGFAAARGEFIAVLDADDAYAPSRLQQLAAFAAETGADMVADDLAYYDAVAGIVTGSGSGGAAVPARAVSLVDYLQHNLADGSGLDWGLLKPMFRRRSLLTFGVGYDPVLKHGEDFKLVVDLLLAGATFRILPAPLYLYTQREGAVSRRSAGWSRTSIAYAKLAEAARDMAADPRIAANPAQVALLHRRAAGLSRLDDAHFLSGALRAGALRQIARRVARDRKFLPLMARQLGRAIARRVPWGWAVVFLLLTMPAAQAATGILWGVSISGMDFGNGAKAGTNYAVPDPGYYLQAGVGLVRIPFKISRIQSTPDAPLVPDMVAALHRIVALDQAAGAVTVLDPHGYGFYDIAGMPNDILKSPDAASDYVDLMRRIATAFAGDDVAIGLMNEPHTGSDAAYAAIWNRAIAAMRQAGFHGVILVPHAHWSAAADISPASPYAGVIDDPDHNWVLELHSYLDPDGTGTYRQKVADPAVGAARLQGAIAWSRQSHVKIFLGETGAPPSDVGLSAFATMLNAIAAQPDVFWGVAVWGAGSWWKPDYPMRLDPLAGVERPQFTLLEQMIAPQLIYLAKESGAADVRAAIEIDGKPLGPPVPVTAARTTAPQAIPMRRQLSPGRHKVTVRPEGGALYLAGATWKGQPDSPSAYAAIPADGYTFQIAVPK